MISLPVSDDPNGTLKTPTMKGFIVYSRSKKSRHLSNESSSDDNSLKRLKTCESEGVSCLKSEAAFLGEEGGDVKLFNGEVQNNVDETVRRFTRSALKPKVEEIECSEDDALVEKNNCELKMSHKIVLSKKPMTVKEVFDTGLLDGVSVVYMGGKVSFFLSTLHIDVYIHY